MAEETLVKEPLTETMIKAGANVLDVLDRGDVGVDAAFWLYQPDSNQWRFVLAVAKVHTDGPKKTYRRILQQLRNYKTSAVPVDSIAVIDAGDPLVRVFRNVIHTDRATSGFRFSRNTFNGRYIEDAYIYRMAA